MRRGIAQFWDFIVRFFKSLLWWKEKLETLDFKIKFHRPTELENVGLPIEIRRADFSLVKIGLTSEPLKLEPGEYFVVSKMPAGQELLSRVEIKTGEPSTAFLRLEENDESPRESEDIQHYHVANRQKVLSAIENLTGTEESVTDSVLPTVKIRVFTGNPLTENFRQTQADWQSVASGKGLLGFEIPGTTDELQIVQLLQTDAPPLNMLLPAMRGHDCRLFITNLIDGKYTLDAHLENQTADLLLRYSNKGFSRETKLVGKELDAENLLKSKVSDPIAAAVGAYALLRFNRLEALRDWTENLRQWFKWLPDGAAIRGEHLAQSGRHEEAFRALLEIEARGLPIFSKGLSYTIDRLSTYLDAEPDFIDSENFKRTKNLVGKLQKFAAYTDFREPFTTFTGLDINNPSAAPLEEIPKDDNALDLTETILEYSLTDKEEKEGKNETI
jgi:hypothetical protein